MFSVTSDYVHAFLAPLRQKAEKMFLLSSPYEPLHPLSKILVAPAKSRDEFPLTLALDSRLKIFNLFSFWLKSGTNNTDPMRRITCIFESICYIYIG